MTGISVDLETMAKAVYEFSGLADEVQHGVDELQSTINALPFGSEIVSQAFSALYTFAASWFEEALASHRDLLKFASDSVKSWADAIGATDDDLAKAFNTFMQAVENGGS
ncbi:MAG: hypothetical protein ACTHMS_07680 [Jatrophihabitans sp.]|uniref:hypothetical protein n=1 Tax=Jatrophihabitans sp. TaxID=1932789 RepID=UPI003F806431